MVTLDTIVFVYVLWCCFSVGYAAALVGMVYTDIRWEKRYHNAKPSMESKRQE